MGRHNDVKKALNDARIPDKHDKLMRLLLDKARFEDAEVSDDQWAPSIATLARRLSVSEDSVRIYLADLKEHGWFTRYETDRRGRVAGLLGAGRSYGFSTEGLCPVCGRPLPSPRAKTCRPRCRQALSRMNRDKAQVSRPDVTLPAAEPAEPPSSRTNCDFVTLPSSHVTKPSVTNPRSDHELTEEIRDEEEVVEEQPADDLGLRERCGWCGVPPDKCICIGCDVNDYNGCRLQLVLDQLGGKVISYEEKK